MSDDPFSNSTNALMQLWQQWLGSMSQLNPGAAGAGNNPFAQIFGDVAGQSSPLPGMSSVLPGVDAFLSFGESIRRQLEADGQSEQPFAVHELLNTWVEQIMQGYELWSNAASLGANPLNPEQSPAQLFEPLKMLFGQMPGGMAPAFFSGFQPQINEFDITGIKFPSYGPAREWQDLGKRIYQTHGRLERARFEFDQRMQKIMFKALRQFQQGLQDSDGELESLKAIYDYWIDKAEQAYHDEVMTEGYAKAFGELINSQSALKSTVTELLNRVQEMINLPNRREIDTLSERMTGLERKLDNVVRAPSLDQANDETLAELRREIEMLREQLSRPRLAAVTAEPKAPEQKTPRARRPEVAEVTSVAAKASTPQTSAANKNKSAKSGKKRKTDKRKPRTQNATKNEFGISAILDAS